MKKNLPIIMVINLIISFIIVIKISFSAEKEERKDSGNVQILSVGEKLDNTREKMIAKIGEKIFEWHELKRQVITSVKAHTGQEPLNGVNPIISLCLNTGKTLIEEYIPRLPDAKSMSDLVKKFLNNLEIQDMDLENFFKVITVKMIIEKRFLDNIKDIFLNKEIKNKNYFEDMLHVNMFLEEARTKLFGILGLDMSESIHKLSRRDVSLSLVECYELNNTLHSQYRFEFCNLIFRICEFQSQRYLEYAQMHQNILNWASDIRKTRIIHVSTKDIMLKSQQNKDKGQTPINPLDVLKQSLDEKLKDLKLIQLAEDVNPESSKSVEVVEAIKVEEPVQKKKRKRHKGKNTLNYTQSPVSSLGPADMVGKDREMPVDLLLQLKQVMDLLREATESLGSAQGEARELTDSMANLEDRLKSVEDMKEKLQGKNETLQQQTKVDEEEKASLATEKKGLQKLADSKSQDMQRVMDEKAKATSEVTGLKKQVTERNNKLATLETELKKSQNDLQQLQQQRLQTEKDKTKFQQDINKLQKQLDGKIQAINLLETQHKREQETIQEKCEAELSRKATQLQHEMVGLKREIFVRDSRIQELMENNMVAWNQAAGWKKMMLSQQGSNFSPTMWYLRLPDGSPISLPYAEVAKLAEQQLRKTNRS